MSTKDQTYEIAPLNISDEDSDDSIPIDKIDNDIDKEDTKEQGSFLDNISRIEEIAAIYNQNLLRGELEDSDEIEIDKIDNDIDKEDTKEQGSFLDHIPLSRIVSLNQNDMSTQQQFYQSDMYDSSGSSLAKSLISWLAITIFLIVFAIPLYTIISVYIIILMPLSLQLVGNKYAIYIISISILSMLYILHVTEVYDIRIFAFYSILPLIVSIIFRDCIIFALQIRENIRVCVDDETPNKVCCGCNINRIIQCNTSMMTFCKISKLLSYFAKNYHIWGITLNQYIPFGNIRLPSRDDKEEFEVPITVPFKQAINDIFQHFDDSGLFTFKTSWKTACLADKIIIFAMICSGIFYILLPALYYIIFKLVMEPHEPITWVIVDIIQFVFGIGINLVIVYSITLYTEVIFYQLFKYYNYMKKMGDLIVIPQMEAKQNPNENSKENSKDRTTEKDVEMTEIDLEMVFAMAEIEMSEIEMSEIEMAETLQTVKHIFLCEGNNCQVWFENWCRIQKIASLYFERKKSWIFGVMFSISLGIGIILYNIFFKGQKGRWFDGNIIMISCALIYFIMAFIRLLLESVRFSNLQKRHIAMIQIQHTVTIRRKSKGIIDDLDERKALNIACEYLNNIKNEIEMRSVSPTIAGVSLNVALVRLFVSAVLGVITSLLTYAWRQV